MVYYKGSESVIYIHVSTQVRTTVVYNNLQYWLSAADNARKSVANDKLPTIKVWFVLQIELQHACQQAVH